MRRLLSCLFLALCVLPGYTRPDRLTTAHPELVFQYTNPFDLPLYEWPRTLIDYLVCFDKDIDAEHRLELTDRKTGKPVPFQLADKRYEDGRLIAARIYFFASLPRGGSYDYILHLGGRKAPLAEQPVRINRQGTEWTVGTDAFAVTLPSILEAEGHQAPAPVCSVRNGNRTIGTGRLYSPHHRIVRMETSVEESGDLFALCKVCYLLENGATYRARIQIVQGYPFVVLDEEIEGLTQADSVYLEMEWNGFHPTRKYVNWDRQKEMAIGDGIPIEQPTYTNYSQEDPFWTGSGWVEEVDKQMIYRLLPFGGNSTREQVPAMTFWETGRGAAELGFFVYDHLRWNDRQYGIWQPTSDLSVYFRYAHQTLYCRYPILAGTRSTAIALTDVEAEQPKVDQFNHDIDQVADKGGKDRSTEMGFRYSMMLHRQYALLSLNRVKNWVLTYPEHGRRPQNPFDKRPMQKTADQFYQQMIASPMAYYMTGQNGFPGIHSIAHRPIYSQWTQDYLEHYPALSPEQRTTVEGLFLLAGYVNMLESMNAVRFSLAGAANMAADGWAVTGQTAFLFPEHPMAKEWADYYQKMIEINGKFYTRPTVGCYQSSGGRWVESLGIYNWAYLRPTAHSNIALECYDGKNRMADSCMAERGKWMVDMTTAARTYAPHGAHGGGREVPRFAPVYELGNWLQHFDPLTAEHLRWLGPMGKDVEERPNDTPWAKVHQRQHDTSDQGTNPHLRSCKYTGHGIVLRAGVDTDEEISIHLDQIDKGPNYRWGYQGQGHTGGLYFYTKDKVYSGHENEAAGDHAQNNTDGVTNFGVMKNSTFCSIGMNELVAPLYDLGEVQMAELRSDSGPASTSWPEYLSRSILLVGTDYFILYDQTGTNWRAFHRFSWFVQKEDEFPDIFFVGKSRPDHWYKAETRQAKGFYRDGAGSLLTLVTHKKSAIRLMDGKTTTPSLFPSEGIQEFMPQNKDYPDGVLRISAPQSTDWVFRKGTGIRFITDSIRFEGEAGVARQKSDGRWTLALLKGKEIAAGGFGLTLQDTEETAVSLTCTSPSSCIGRFQSDGKGTLLLQGLTGGRLFVDGIAYESKELVVRLPQGSHTIEYTTRDAMPLPSTIDHTVRTADGADIFVQMPTGVKEVRLELSADGGKSWRTLATTRRLPYRLKGLPLGKYHVRAISLNGKREADQADEYPIYLTEGPNATPEGLKLRLGHGTVEASWGQVLGAKTYRLYRRRQGEQPFHLVYEGQMPRFTDTQAEGVVPCAACPGSQDNPSPLPADVVVYEYTLTVVDGLGESAQAPVVDTHPYSWSNWYPATPWRFKRRSAFWAEPYVAPEQMPPLYYPDNE